MSAFSNEAEIDRWRGLAGAARLVEWLGADGCRAPRKRATSAVLGKTVRYPQPRAGRAKGWATIRVPAALAPGLIASNRRMGPRETALVAGQQELNL